MPGGSGPASGPQKTGKQEALLSYKKTIQQAFQEVSDSLVAARKLKEVVFESEQQVEALREQKTWRTTVFMGEWPRIWKFWIQTGSFSSPN